MLWTTVLLAVVQFGRAENLVLGDNDDARFVRQPFASTLDRRHNIGLEIELKANGSSVVCDCQPKSVFSKGEDLKLSWLGGDHAVDRFACECTVSTASVPSSALPLESGPTSTRPSLGLAGLSGAASASKTLHSTFSDLPTASGGRNGETASRATNGVPTIVGASMSISPRLSQAPPAVTSGLLSSVGGSIGSQTISSLSSSSAKASLIGCRPVQAVATKFPAPSQSMCTSPPSVRTDLGLSAAEADYRTGRLGVAGVQARTWLLSTLTLINTTFAFAALNRSSSLFGSPSITPPIASVPVIGVAVIGDGLIGAVAAAGMLSAIDGDNETAYRHGMSLLGSTTYLSAADGAAWAMISAASRDKSVGWYDLARFWVSNGSLLGPTPLNLQSSAQSAWTNEAAASALSKATAGFSSTYADARAEIIASLFANGTDTQTLSGISKLAKSTAYSQPLPLVAIGEENQSHSWTATPFDFGCISPEKRAHIATSSVGSTATTCATGVDTLGFIMAATSADGNASSLMWSSSNSPDYQLRAALNDARASCPLVLGDTAAAMLDSSLTPAPVTLVKGPIGSSLDALFDPARAIDTIVVLDALSDGSALLAAASRACRIYPERACSDLVPSLPPSASTFNATATFFGCNATSPLVVYIPAAGPTVLDSTMGSMMPIAADRLMDGFASRVYAGRDPSPPTVVQDGETYVIDQDVAAASDPLFSGCLACASVDRSRAREGLQRTPDCVSCFERYCWTPAAETGTADRAAAVRAHDRRGFRDVLHGAFRSMSSS